MSPSYRNQSVDLQSKSTDWFLYDGNIGGWRVKIVGKTGNLSLGYLSNFFVEAGWHEVSEALARRCL